MKSCLGKRVHYLRKKVGLTMDTLGQEIGRSDAHIHNIENTKSFSPKVRDVEKIADVLGTTIGYLLGVGDVSEASACDAAFIRKYKKMDAEGKEKVRKMCDIL